MDCAGRSGAGGALSIMAAGPHDRLRVTVVRSDPSAQGSFEIWRRQPMSVLDVLTEVQRWHDPTLAFRWSCRIAMCGTCTVRVEGRPVLACQTPVERGRKSITIEPLGGFPVVRDLIIDPQPFVDRWRRVTPAFAATEGLTEPARVRPDSAERQTIDSLLDCISCGACYAACAVSGAESPFLGPAALARSLALIADSRERSAGERLALVAGDDGIDSCHQIGACTAVCPKGIDPAGAIRVLRRRRLGRGA